MKKIHRFFYNFKIVNNVINIDDFEIVNQIRNVLKLNVEEKIVLFFNDNEIVCKIQNINKKFIECNILENKQVSNINNSIILYCAILKKDNFELVVQKASEIGVNKIVPIITERTIKTNLNIERLNKIAQEACEQAERSNISNVSDIEKFKDCLKINSDCKILFDFSGDEFDNLKLKNKKNISFFIGPEGGFTDSEVKIAKDNGFIISRLGKNVLRGETAAIVASYLLIN